jgi:hypothetical protein
MSKLFKLVVNCETGVQEEVELTTQEIAEIEANRKINIDKAAQQEVKAKAKAALLVKLDITQAEVDLLLA